MTPKSLSGGTSDWKVTEMPKGFAGKKAFVLPGAFYSAVVILLAEAGFEKADSIEDADVVAFIGGADINPALYGERARYTYGISHERDALEEAMYKRAQELGKVCFGICRGAQFLHAMNGGTLWQDVDGHGGRNHMIVDIELDCRVEATSIHHQMLRENDDITIVAVCEDQVARKFRSEHLDIDLSRAATNASMEMEIEAGAYDATKCFFVQGHPEIGSPAYRSWTMSKLWDFYHDWTGGVKPIEEVINNMENI